jgi:ABC-type uncharacterized transport system auxiliary subunit
MKSMLKVLFVVALSALLLPGCITSAPPPPKSWMVTASRSANTELMVDKVARLGSITVAAPYDRPALAVKRADGSVAFDAYNAFASSPSALLRAPLAALLEDHGRFGRVLSSASTARAHSTLEVVVSDLSLDCRETGRRIAKVSISIAVIEGREVRMFLDGSGSADAASGDYSAAFSEAFANAVSDALKGFKEN